MKMNKRIINGMLSGVLAMGVGSTTAFANSSETGSATDTQTQVTVPVKESQVLILPGDFFYFLKTLVQKMEIVYTVDDVKQAKLLTVFTQERIREADALLAEGKPALAVATLNKAVDDQEQVMEDDKEHAGTSANEELSDHYRSNLEALTYVLKKVKNPHAKAALARNIEKTKAKLAQITKPAEETGEEPENRIHIQVQSTQVQKSGIEEERDDARQHEDTDADEGDQEGSGKNSVRKAVHEQLKKERKAAHERAKEERKAVHEQAKHQRNR